MSERIAFDFDNRYGGYRPPWNYCRGRCEAMGAVPVNLSSTDDGAALTVGEDLRLLSLAVEQHLRGDGHEDGRCDGWHFVQCPDCGGTGEISKVRALRYLPGKALRTLRFVWKDGVRGYSRLPWTTWREHMAMVLRAAVGRPPR